MLVRLWSNFQKPPDSTKVPSGGTEKTCEVDAEISVLTPVIKLGGFCDWNYCYIGNFKRYYYVSDISFVHGYTYLKCICDIPASYKAQICDTSAYVTRCADLSKQQLNMSDNLYPATCSVSKRSTSVSLGWRNENQNPVYLVTVSGKNGYNVYAMEWHGFEAFCNALYLGWGGIDGMSDVMLALSDPTSYLKDIRITKYPLQSITGTIEKVTIAGIELDVQALKVTDYSVLSTCTLPISTSAEGVPEIDTRPSVRLSATYELVLPGLIRVALPPYVYETGVSIGFHGDLLTGKCYYEVAEATTGKHIETVSGIFTVKFAAPVTVANIGGMAGSVIQTAASIATGNYLGIVSGVANGAMSILPHHSDIGALDSLQNLTGWCTIYANYPIYPDEDITNNGRPCMRYLRLGDLSGYVKCENVKFAGASTVSENQQIISLLESGVHIE